MRFFNLPRIFDMENVIEKNHNYFTHFKILKDKLEIDYSHLDLLYIRNSNQKLVVNDFLNTRNEKKLDFVNKQIEISLRLLIESEPKMILIANAEASRQIVKRFRNNISGCLTTYGRLIFSIEGKHVPLLPWSHLKYLSNGLFYSSLWMIKQIIDSPINLEEINTEFNFDEFVKKMQVVDD